MTSDLLKIHYACRNDDNFARRVEAACWSSGLAFSPAVLARVAKDTVSDISLTDEGTISTEKITDAQILASLQEQVSEAGDAASQVTVP